MKSSLEINALQCYEFIHYPLSSLCELAPAFNAEERQVEKDRTSELWELAVEEREKEKEKKTTRVTWKLWDCVLQVLNK